MNLPFGLLTRKETVQRRKDDELDLSRLEDMLAGYQKLLADYRKFIREYYDRLEDKSKDAQDEIIANVQAALDLACIKEQSEKTGGLVEGLNQQMESISSQLLDIKSGLAQKGAERLESLSISLAEVTATVDKLSRSVKRGRALNVFLLILNILGLGMLAFILLYALDIIPF